MDSLNFKNMIKEFSNKRPLLLSLNTDQKAAEEMITDVEKYYDIKLPKQYKEFVKDYGGGYFGFIVVFSCDHNSMFYIKDNVAKNWIYEKNFIPIIDLETGDFWGFEIKEGICQKTVGLYSHEEDEIQESTMDFFDVLIKYGFKSKI
ncbi:hypothetical protein IMSAGC007_01764 [Lachnospiraceae bacterium]|nr:hypothetical protein IMSAGC007_01764 [Lachnospiraceae bacterium]